MATTTADQAVRLPGARPQDRRAGESWIRRLPLLPALVFTIIVTQIPFLLTIYYSLQSWNIAKPGSPHWVGLHNYGDVFSDPVFYAALLHTIEITFGMVRMRLFVPGTTQGYVPPHYRPATPPSALGSEPAR